MSTNELGQPTGSVLYGATVVVLNKGISPIEGQGVLAISKDGCFYLENGMPCAIAISLKALDNYLKKFTESGVSADTVAIIRSAITSFQGGA